VRFLPRVAPGLVLVLVAGLSAGCSEQNTSEPLCPAPGLKRNLTALVLMAQGVPSAAYVPCISQFPAGWSFGGETFRDSGGQFWLDSDRAGFRAITVVLAPSCDTSKAVEVPQEPNEPATMRRFEEPKALPPAFSGNRYYVFPGGCVTYRFAFGRDASFAQVVEISEALTFVSRALGVRELAKEGVVLCGRSAPPCPG
jgi:hypothetical protein